jgi:hypothetical protein
MVCIPSSGGGGRLLSPEEEDDEATLEEQQQPGHEISEKEEIANPVLSKLEIVLSPLLRGVVDQQKNAVATCQQIFNKYLTGNGRPISGIVGDQIQTPNSAVFANLGKVHVRGLCIAEDRVCQSSNNRAETEEGIASVCTQEAAQIRTTFSLIGARPSIITQGTSSFEYGFRNSKHATALLLTKKRRHV